MVRRHATIVLILVLLLGAAAAAAAQNLDVAIRLYNEEVYFPDSPVYVHVQVTNPTAHSIQFRLADDRTFNLDFVVARRDNRPLERTEEFSIRRATNQVFFRTVVLEPGERFSFVEPLHHYVTLGDPGTYTVHARFYPQLSRHAGSDAVPSNSLAVTVRPGFTTQVRQEMLFEAVVQQELQRVRLSPDEIVDAMIDALRQSNWERFFLNLNLEKIYRQATERDRRFRLLGEEQQLEEIRAFRTSLMESPASRDAELVLIPDHYEILETTYTPTDGRVTVMMYYDYDRFRERRRYTFRFQRRNGFWEVIGYQVDNLPNEALRR